MITKGKMVSSFKNSQNQNNNERYEDQSGEFVY